MKRNKDWALGLLRFLEEAPDGDGLSRHELKVLFDQSDLCPSMSSEDIWDAFDYHLHLLTTAGFVLATKSDKGMAHDDFDLTWAGHDYLEIEG